MGLTQARAFLLLRYTLIVATAYLLLVEGSFAVPSTSTVLLIAGALTSNVIAAFLPRALLLSFPFAVGVILFDTAWITAALVISGNFSADFFYLYFFVLLLAAVGESISLIAVAAAVLCGFYLYGHLAAGGSWSLWNSPSLIRLPFLFAAAIFYGYLIDRTRLERRRADLKGEMARQLARTVDELRVAHAKAQESDRIKSTFLATVSHELRTPLVSIIGYVDLMLEGVYGSMSKEQSEVLGRVQVAGTNLYHVIGGLLDASRLDLGVETVEPVECDLSHFLGELSTDCPGSRSVRIYYPSRVAVPTIYTDEVKLRRILMNLIDNAVRFTERGVVTVDVRWDPPRDRIEFRVSDTGPGIPDQLYDQIFEAFRQGVERPNETTTGIGLGLYIVKRLVTLLGGEVSVASTIGEGSTFTIALPRHPPLRAGAAADRIGALTTH